MQIIREAAVAYATLGFESEEGIWKFDHKSLRIDPWVPSLSCDIGADWPRCVRRQVSLLNLFEIESYLP